MSDHESIAELLPWYLNGTLDSGDRERAERHLAACVTCRDTLAEVAELTSEPPPEPCLDHVSPRLLIDYVERPGALDDETVRFVEERLAACDVCREAYAILQEVDGHLAAAQYHDVPLERARAALSRLWQLLAATILRPAPALVYLALLLIALPAIWLGRSPAPAPVSSPRIVVAHGERLTRGQAERPAPLAVGATPGPVLLELVTELARDDVEGPRAAFFVEIHRAGARLWSEDKRGAEFLVRDGRVVLPLLVYPERIGSDGQVEIVVRARKPGDPLDGQVLFRRSLAFRAE